MSVAVVILNWNGQSLLKKFLPTVIESVKNMPEASIYVADNGSNDGSVAFVRKEYPEVNLITFQKNHGFAGGYNRALAQIETEYYVLLNSDVEVTKNWLKILYAYMQNNKDVAACQPKILSYNNKKYFEYAGACGGYIDKFGYPFCRGRILNTVEEDKGQYDTIVDVFWASGACLMIRSEIYHKVGGLDNAFFAHMEEIDMCWRIKSRGYRITCNPESVVYHVGGETLKRDNPRKTFLNFRNNLLMLYKNLPHKHLKKIFETRYYLDNIATLQYMLKGELDNMRAIIMARTEFRKNKASFAEKRKENILKSVSSTFSEISQNSIIYEYYIKRHRKFSELKRDEIFDIEVAKESITEKKLKQ